MAGGDLAGRAAARLGERPQQRAVALVDGDRRLDRRADRLGLGAVARRGQVDLGLVELLDRLAAGPHSRSREVVEVAVEDRAPEPGPLHDLADAELGVGALAHQLGRRVDDPLAAFLAALAGFAACLVAALHRDRG